MKNIFFIHDNAAKPNNVKDDIYIQGLDFCIVPILALFS